MKGLIKGLIAFVMWHALRHVVRALPLRAIAFIGRSGGTVLRAISGDKAAVMAEELRLIMPGAGEAEIDGVVRAAFVNYATSEVEVLLYPALNSRLIGRMVETEGIAHLDEALAKGRGVVLFQAHFGAFQMVMPAIGYSGYRMSQISAPATVWKGEGGLKGGAFDLKARHEYSLPVTHIPVNSSMRPAFRALERNEILGVTVDGGGGRSVVKVGFLGREANFQQGGAEIALKTGAAVVPAFIMTEPGLRHRLIIHPPIEAKDARAVIQEFAGILEGYVQRRPDHYAYSLYLRRERAGTDAYPFFTDHTAESLTR
jgi:KDO2-lipid IV(A) lauroyltransferase